MTPNPTLSGCNLSIQKEFKEDLYISLFDMNNRLIYKERIEKVNNPIFIEGESLTPGLYFIHISTSKNNFTLKAMKI
ncbi:MAG: T9SS type A sorting domain-containing protein [Bacteroidetes bacterium]|nr:T9SS type A sorting domain-containing protein [Bacteroidota bacterium]